MRPARLELINAELPRIKLCYESVLQPCRGLAHHRLRGAPEPFPKEEVA